MSTTKRAKSAAAVDNEKASVYHGPGVFCVNPGPGLWISPGPCHIEKDRGKRAGLPAASASGCGGSYQPGPLRAL